MIAGKREERKREEEGEILLCIVLRRKGTNEYKAAFTSPSVASGSEHHEVDDST